MANTISTPEILKGGSALVTGGLGFIGRHVVQQLVDLGVANIDVIDDCSNSSPVMPSSWNGVVTHHEVSVTTEGWLDLLKDRQTVIHLACKTLLECDSDPILDQQVNSGSTLRMLEYIRQMRGQQPSFVYASSACVYGKTPPHPITEDYPLRPTTPYGVSKLAGEQYAVMYAARYGLDSCAVRISNAYGPGQTPDNAYCGVIGKFMRWAAEGEDLRIVGDGKQSRDFTYVGDTARGLILAAASNHTQAGVFNAATGERTTVNDVALGVQRLYPGVQLRTVPLRPIDDIRHRTLDSGLLRDTAGWSANTPLASGLSHTRGWMDAQLSAA